MLNFLHDLLEQGRVVVPLVPETVSETSADLDRLIGQVDAHARLELALSPPQLSIPAAVWALRLIENACRFLVYRDLDETVISAALELKCPVPPSPDCAYSADLFLRYLPDLASMARGVGESDPLVKHLQQIAARWPLSSVGMAAIACDAKDLDVIVSHPGLLQLYVDRIIGRNDAGRLTPPAVRNAVRTALGGHPSLAPEISRAIETSSKEQD